MKLSDLPSGTFPIPFAASAGGGFIRTVPVASQIGITDGAASLTDGFPPLNFLPVGSGGTPPFGQDTNGILNQITQWTRWQNAGALVKYKSAFSTDVGGYPQGAIVASATNSGVVWLCLADDNTTDPDSSSAANWAGLLTNIGSSGLSPTIYVRTDGNDNNTGNSNTAGGALATIAAALAKLQSRYYLAGGIGTVQLGNAGTYTFPGQVSALGGSIHIVGDPSNQSSYIISGAGPGSGSSALLSAVAGNVTLSGVTVVNAGSIPTNSNVSAVSSGAQLFLQNVTLGTSAITVQSLMLASAGGGIVIGSGCILNGAANTAMLAQSASITIGGNISMASSPSYSIAMAQATVNGSILLASSAFTITGSASGSRYSATLNGVINTAGGGANYFPGSTAGSTATGGQYA